MDNSQTCKGSEVKILVEAELPSELHLSGVDFYCEFFASMGKHTIQKEEMKQIDDDSYVANVDSSITGTGNLFLKIYVDLPDADFSNGARREIVKVPTGVKIVG